MPNNSGITPVGCRILVLPDQAKETDDIFKSAQAAGIKILSEEERQKKEKLAQTKGILVAVGPEAWSDSECPWAYVGDRIFMGKYSGLIETGKDGKDYRIINDIDLVAILEEDEEE